jgi:hypothetical protein
MNKDEILSTIRKKREFSQLPEKDILLAYGHFEKRQASDDGKIKLTKELLRKIFSAFVSPKLLSPKDKDEEWILRKHASTRERLPHYLEIYRRIFEGYKKASVIDLGAGINGFSYKFFREIGVTVDYIAIEAVGQLADFMNYYFVQKRLKGKAVHLSLFEKEKVLKIISDKNLPRVVFMLKIIDALESMKRDCSTELILDVARVAERIVLSYPTKSLGNRERFRAKRGWIVEFLKDNFNILDEFEFGGERYIIFSK